MNILLIALKWLFHILVFPGFLFTLIAALLLAGIDRKLVARMQNRVGPPILQPVYDLLKLFGKEVIIPRQANKKAFLSAPAVGLASLLVTSLILPFSAAFVAVSGVADVIVVLYLLTIPAVAIIVGAASSASPFAGVGLSREMVAVMAYELPLTVVLIAVCRKAGLAMEESGMTFSFATIMQYQAEHGAMITKLSMWPAALAMLFIVPCEVGAHPFDIAEAETEICEGTLAEYSGLPLAFYELGHYVKMFILTSLFCVLFLGGFTTGIIFVDLILRLLFCLIVTFITITVPHAVCARFKVEQVFKFYWTWILGLAFISLLLVWLGL